MVSPNILETQFRPKYTLVLKQTNLIGSGCLHPRLSNQTGHERTIRLLESRESGTLHGCGVHGNQSQLLIYSINLQGLQTIALFAI